MKVEKLVEGVIYKHVSNNNIVKWGKPKQHYLGNGSKEYSYSDGNWENNPQDFIFATQQEANWLKICIRLGKFITFKESLNYNCEPEYEIY